MRGATCRGAVVLALPQRCKAQWVKGFDGNLLVQRILVKGSYFNRKIEV